MSQIEADIENLKSEWKPPTLESLPAKLDGLISLDLETCDYGLQKKQGPGWAWKDGGFVVGYAIEADNWAGYLPINHEGGGNLDAVKVREILNRWLGNPNQAKCGANILYDLGWSKRDGVTVQGPCYDVQWAEALLDEHRWGYNLDGLAKSYLNEGKEEGLLRQAAAAWGVDPKEGLWRLPSMFVGPYAMGDANKTRRVFLLQAEKLKNKDLWNLFEMECSLLPLYLDMRWRGVRVDIQKALALKEQWQKEVKEALDEIKSKTGEEISLWAAASIAKALDKEKIPYKLTEKTKKPSITKAYLEDQEHWLPKLILKARVKDKLSGTFIDGAILGNVHDGRIHTEFHPLRETSEEGEGSGTVTGRLSSSNPNLQQVPKRSEEGKLLRQCFLPEEGEQWYSLDYSQQEPRLTVHYAAICTQQGQPLPGALEAVEKYVKDPKMSYHKMVADETGLDYDQAKIMNLALTYGRGVESTARVLGVPLEKAKEYIKNYHEKLPFIKALDNILKNKIEESSFNNAARVGEFKTLLKRCCRFPFFELAPIWVDGKIVNEEEYKNKRVLPYFQALKQWPGKKIQRAWMHKKLNRLIQGSAADQTKKAMQLVMQAGLGAHLLVQVHDELCFSFPKKEMAEQAARLMEEAVKLKVPVIAEIKTGDNWGVVK